jgi:hypothetical protein
LFQNQPGFGTSSLICIFSPINLLLWFFFFVFPVREKINGKAGKRQEDWVALFCP